jgi:hypothetical protein
MRFESCLWILVLLLAPARAQDVAPRVLAALERGERLQLLEARDGLRAALEQALTSGAASATAPSAETARELAAAVLAARALATCDDQLEDWNSIEAWYAAHASAAAAAPPELAGLLAQQQANALRALGRNDAALQLSQQQGFVSDAWILGPFDNERGAGYDRTLAPELGMALDARATGKSRELGWRRNPAPQHPLGRVLLHELLRPVDDAVAYAATLLESERETAALLVLSTACSYKLWLGGELVAARDARRPLTPDQDWIPVRLRAGRSELLLKLANEDQGWWGYALRVADSEGRPLAGVRGDAQALQRLAPVSSSTRAFEADAFDPPTLRAVASALDLRSTALCAQLEYYAHPHDAQGGALVGAAEREVALAPAEASAHYRLSRALRGRLERTLEEDAVDRRLAALRRTLELDPTHAGALADLSEHYLDDAPQPERVEELSLRALSAAPLSARATRLRARHLDERERVLEARALLEHVLTLPETAAQPWAAAARAERLVELGRRDEALGLLRAAFDERRLGGPVRAALRARLVDAGLEDEALRVEADVLAGAPFEVDTRLASAELEELRGDAAAARIHLEAALALCPDDTRAWRALARVEQRLGDRAGADRALGQLLVLEPGDTRARRARALLASAGVESFETPYRWDAVARATAHARGAPLALGEPVQVIDRTKVWKVDADGAEHVYEHVLLRAQNERGVQLLDEWPIVHAERAQPYVHQVRVIRADGSFERATPPRRARALGSDRVARVWNLPPLAAGDYVEAEWRIDERGPDVFGRYFGARHLFQADFPDAQASVLRSELVVLSAPALNVYVAERNTREIEHELTVDPHGLRLYRFVARNLPRPAPEGFMPPLDESVPVVDLSTYPDWTAFGRWWWNFIEKEFDTSAELQAKVAELVQGQSTERERVEAIARFVGQEVRYNSWPFGTHGYEPFSASTIFERRLGDCKDKSILLRQMLAEIGVSALPVLIRAQYRRGDEPLAAAMVEHFNHCIAWVEPTPQRDGYFLDATADHNPIDTLREDDQGARVLIVGPSGVELRDIPYDPASANTLQRRYEVELADDGSGVVAVRDTSNGQFGVRLRQRYAGRADGLAARLAADYESAFSKIDVLEARASELDDIAAPAWLEARFRAGSLWTLEAGAPTLGLYFDPLPILDAAAEAPATRTHDLLFDRPFGLATTSEWKLPAGRAPRALPAPVRVEVPGLLRYHCEVRATAAGCAIERSFELLERRVPLARYAEFQAALREIASSERRRIELSGVAAEEQR